MKHLLRYIVKSGNCTPFQNDKKNQLYDGKHLGEHLGKYHGGKIACILRLAQPSEIPKDLLQT